MGPDLYELLDDRVLVNLLLELLLLSDPELCIQGLGLIRGGWGSVGIYIII